MWSTSTQDPGTIHQEVRTGCRVLSVLKIKTDSLRVTPVFPLVHKYFVWLHKFPASDGRAGRSGDLLLGYIIVMRVTLLRSFELYPILRIVQIICDSKHLSSGITVNTGNFS